MKKITRFLYAFRLLWKHIYGFTAPFFLSEDKRYRLYDIGEYTYGKPTLKFETVDSRLTIGRYCSIAKGVKIYLGGEHRTDWVTTFPFSTFFKSAEKFTDFQISKGPVVIGHDVWIGDDTVILSGVHIGNGAVIGVGSVVTKNVEPYSIVAGNPARFIRYRFNTETIKALEEIAWWNWPLEDIQKAWPLMLSPDISSFISRYKKG